MEAGETVAPPDGWTEDADVDTYMEAAAAAANPKAPHQLPPGPAEAFAGAGHDEPPQTPTGETMQVLTEEAIESHDPAVLQQLGDGVLHLAQARSRSQTELKSLDRAMTVINKLTVQRDGLQDKVHHSESSAKRAEDRATQLEVQRRVAESRLQALLSEQVSSEAQAVTVNQTMAAQLQERDQTIAALNGQVGELKVAEIRLQAALAEQASAAVQMEERDSAAAALNAQVAELTALKAALEGELGAAKESADAVAFRHATDMQHLASEQAAAMAGRAAELEAVKSDLRSRSRDQSSSSAVSQRLQEELEDEQKVSKQLQAGYDEINAKLRQTTEDYEKRLDGQQKEHAAATADLQHKISTLGADSSEVRASQGQAEARLAGREQDVAALRTEVSESRAENSRLLGELQVQSATIAALNTGAKKHQADLEAQASAMKQLKAGSAQMAKEQARALSYERDQLAEKAASFQQELQQSRAQLDAAALENKELSREAARNEKTYSDVAQKVRGLEAETRLLEEKTQRLEQESSGASEEAASLKEERARAQSQLTAAEERCAYLSSQAASAQEERAREQSHLQKVEKKCSDLVASLTKVDGEVAVLQSDLEGKSEQAGRMAAKIGSLEKKLAQTQEENGGLAAQMQALLEAGAEKGNSDASDSPGRGKGRDSAKVSKLRRQLGSTKKLLEAANSRHQATNKAVLDARSDQAAIEQEFSDFMEDCKNKSAKHAQVAMMAKEREAECAGLAEKLEQLQARFEARETEVVELRALSASQGSRAASASKVQSEAASAQHQELQGLRKQVNDARAQARKAEAEASQRRKAGEAKLAESEARRRKLAEDLKRAGSAAAAAGSNASAAAAGKKVAGELARVRLQLEQAVGERDGLEERVRSLETAGADPQPAALAAERDRLKQRVKELSSRATGKGQDDLANALSEKNRAAQAARQQRQINEHLRQQLTDVKARLKTSQRPADATLPTAPPRSPGSRSGESNASVMSAWGNESSTSVGTTTAQLINRLREAERDRDHLAEQLEAAGQPNSRHNNAAGEPGEPGEPAYMSTPTPRKPRGRLPSNSNNSLLATPGPTPFTPRTQSERKRAVSPFQLAINAGTRAGSMPPGSDSAAAEQRRLAFMLDMCSAWKAFDIK